MAPLDLEGLPTRSTTTGYEPTFCSPEWDDRFGIRQPTLAPQIIDDRFGWDPAVPLHGRIQRQESAKAVIQGRWCERQLSDRLAAILRRVAAWRVILRALPTAVPSVLIAFDRQ